MSQSFITSLLPYNQELGVQQNLLNKGFELGLEAQLGYEALALQVDFPKNAGNTFTYTRGSQLAPLTTPIDPSTLNQMDNVSTENYTEEQYSIRIDSYGKGAEVNLIANQLGIASIEAENAFKLGENSRRSLDLFRRDTLLRSYMGGQTRLTTTIGAPGITIHVDDIRGFDFVIPTTGTDGGKQVPVSPTNPMPVLVGSTVYTLVAATPDMVNTSSVILVGGTLNGQGISGDLTFSTNVSVPDGTSGNQVKSAFAAKIIRPGTALTTADLTPTDKFTLSSLRKMLTVLKNSNIDRFDNGKYLLMLSPETFDQIAEDAEFQRLYRGSMLQSEVYSNYHIVGGLLGCDIVETNIPPIQDLNGLTIQRPMVVGKESLIQANAQAMDAFASKEYSSDIYQMNMVKNVLMVNRKPIQRVPMLKAQSWFYLGGWTATTDQTTTPVTLPTSNYAYYKRAVICEHAS